MAGQFFFKIKLIPKRACVFDSSHLFATPIEWSRRARLKTVAVSPLDLRYF